MKNQPTVEQYVELKDIANQLHAATADLLDHLYWRWQDEYGYEDFADYENVMRKKVASLNIPGVEFVAASESPFGYTAKKYDCEIRATHDGNYIHVRVILS